MYRPCEPIIHYIKVGVRGSALHGYASMMRRRRCLWNVLANKIASNNWGKNGAGNK